MFVGRLNIQNANSRIIFVFLNIALTIILACVVFRFFTNLVFERLKFLHRAR